MPSRHELRTGLFNMHLEDVQGMTKYQKELELSLRIRQKTFQAVSCTALARIDANARSVNGVPVALSVCPGLVAQNVAAPSRGGRHKFRKLHVLEVDDPPDFLHLQILKLLQKIVR